MSKLHSRHQVKLGSEDMDAARAVIEAVPCACHIGLDHTEGYPQYVKRASRADKNKRV